MHRLVVVAPLADRAHRRASKLIAQGPPFDPGATGLDRHAVYLTHNEVVFVFEGLDVEWEVDDLAGELLPGIGDVLGVWRELLAGRPRVAQETYFWERGGTAPGGSAAGSP